MNTTHPSPVLITTFTPEPPHGSVILAYGLTGTAYQRFFSDGLYHSVVPGRVPVAFDFFTQRAARDIKDYIVHTALEED